MFRELIRRIRYRFSHEWCYDQRERDGLASDGCCPGAFGGDITTDYLCMMCIDCPHLKL